LSGREFHPLEAPGLSWRTVMEVNIGERWRNHSPYAKGNFLLERVITGWRMLPVLDLRLKK
jgi:hypothetical protein